VQISHELKKKSKTVIEKKGSRKKGYSLKGWAIKKGGGGVKAGPKGKKNFFELIFLFCYFYCFLRLRLEGGLMAGPLREDLFLRLF